MPWRTISWMSDQSSRINNPLLPHTSQLRARELLLVQGCSSTSETNLGREPLAREISITDCSWEMKVEAAITSHINKGHAWNLQLPQASRLRCWWIKRRRFRNKISRPWVDSSAKTCTWPRSHIDSSYSSRVVGIISSKIPQVSLQLSVKITLSRKLRK